MRGLKVVLGAAVASASLFPLAASAAASSPNATERGHVVAPPACTPDQVAIWINTEGNGAAGSIYYDLEFTNISVHACTLAGYPGVSAVNVSGRQLGRPASRDTEHASTRVNLSGAPVAAGGPVGVGGVATAILQIVDANNFPAAICGRATASGLRVYPPGQTVAKFVSIPFLACSNARTTYLSVEALQQGVPSQ